MPYDIRSTDDCEHEVYNKDTGKAVGCAGSRKKAEAMMRALYANEHEGDDDGGKGLGDLEFKAVPFEIKAAGKAEADGTGPSYLEGIGGAFHNLDGTNDIIAPGAFKDSLDAFIGEGVVGGLNHNWDEPIGHPIEARETPQGLYVKAVLDDSDDARKALARMKVNPVSGRATIRKLSIGYRALDTQRLGTPEEVKSYWAASAHRPDPGELGRLEAAFRPRIHPETGKKYVPGVRLLKSLSLYEISPVTVAANDRADIIAAKCGMGCMGMGGYDAPMPGHGRPGGPTLDDATDRIRDSVVGIFLDYLMMSVRVVVANDMVAPADRLTILGQTFDQTRDAFLQYLKPILLADDDDDAVEDISDTLESLSKQFHAGLEAAGVDLDTKALAGLASGPLDAFLPAVESALGHFVAAHRDRLGIRLKEGRTLSGSNVDRLRRVRHSLHGHVADIDDMLRQAGHEPGEPPAGDEEDGAEAGRRPKPKAAAAPVRPAFPLVPAAAGTQPLLLGGKSAPAPDPTDPADPGQAAPAGPDLSDYFAQFYATDPALLGIDGAQ